MLATDTAIPGSRALEFIVAHVDRPDNPVPMLAALAQRHVRYGVRAEHYGIVGFE